MQDPFNIEWYLTLFVHFYYNFDWNTLYNYDYINDILYIYIFYNREVYDRKEKLCFILQIENLSLRDMKKTTDLYVLKDFILKKH